MKCKECGIAMKKVAAVLLKPGYDMHVYRCLKCELSVRVTHDTRFTQTTDLKVPRDCGLRSRGELIRGER